jgi:hypothetical protein
MISGYRQYRGPRTENDRREANPDGMAGCPSGKRQVEHHDQKTESRKKRDERYQASVQGLFYTVERNVPERRGARIKRGASGWAEVSVGDVHFNYRQ